MKGFLQQKYISPSIAAAAALLVFHRNSKVSFRQKFLANAAPILLRTGAEACENLRPDLHRMQCECGQNQKIGSKSDETNVGSKSEIRRGHAESASAVKYRGVLAIESQSQL